MQISNLGDVLSKLVYSDVSQTGVLGRSPQLPVAMGVWGQSPQSLGDFCKFLKKKAILILLDHISHVFKAIWKNYIFNIWQPIEKIELFSPPFTCNYSPKHV